MTFEELGRQFGLDEAQTRAAFEQLAPVVAAGVRRNTQSPEGLEGLIRALQGGDHARYVEDPSALEYDRVADDGNAILGHVFGSKDVSRGVANQAADLSGIGSSILKKMLPVIAAMVMGQLAKNMGGSGRGSTQPSGGGLGDILGDILGGGAAQPQSRGGGLGDILGDILGGGTGAPQPRSGGQGGGGLGDILGDILGGGTVGGGGVQPQAPRPQPESGGGFSLDDLLREMTGGGQAPQQREEVVRRSRKSIDDMLGGGSQTGNAADDLLNSVERHIRRR
jgi:hypothetical protein